MKQSVRKKRKRLLGIDSLESRRVLAAPVAVNDNFSVVSEVPTFLDVLANDSDPDMDQITVVDADMPPSGRLTVADRGLEYTSLPGFLGQETFSYTITDSSGETSSALVTVTVSTGDNPPIAVDDFAVTDIETLVSIPVLENDTDLDGDELQLSSIVPGFGGTPNVSRDNPNVVEFEPDRGFTGVAEFMYTVSDGVNRSTATVSVAVGAIGPILSGVEVNGGFEDPPDRDIGPQPTSWAGQHSVLQKISLEFSVPVQVPETSDLLFTNLGVDSRNDPDIQIDLSHPDLDLNISTESNNLVLEFAPYSLPDGVYRLDILSLSDLDGNPMPTRETVIGDDSNGMYQLTADWNGDNGVTVFDFTTLAYWFGEDVFPAYVDCNLDGGVTAFDIPCLAGNFGSSLSFPTKSAAKPADFDFVPRATAVDQAITSFVVPEEVKRHSASNGRDLADVPSRALLMRAAAAKARANFAHRPLQDGRVAELRDAHMKRMVATSDFGELLAEDIRESIDVLAKLR